MKLKAYIGYLEAIAEKHPNIKVVSANGWDRDSFSEVTSAPTVGGFQGGSSEGFFSVDEKINAVCLN
jgi:hypothetical protein